jgi:hypothetical protein
VTARVRRTPSNYVRSFFNFNVPDHGESAPVNPCAICLKQDIRASEALVAQIDAVYPEGAPVDTMGVGMDRLTM